MSFFGVRVTEKKTSITAPITAATAVMAFGTAPAHQVGGKANTIVLANSYAEAVEALGWSDDWEKYTLCEVIYSHFKLYGVGPLLLVNVLDASKNKGNSVTKELAIADGQVKITPDAIPDTIKVEIEKKTETTEAGAGSATDSGDGANLDEEGNAGTQEAGESVTEKETLIRGTDYDVFYEDGECIIEALAGGKMASEASVSVSYQPVSFALDDLSGDIIGGYNVSTGESTGMELADQAYFQKKVLPDILIAPYFSKNSGVAAVMAAKAKTLSIVFRSFAVCDIDSASTATYQAAVNAKDGSGAFQNVKERMCWPMLKLDDRKFHLSTQLAGLMAFYAAQDGGIPSEPTSNKTLQADGAILADGTEVSLDLNMANYLRGQGITTALNFVNGFTSWGEYCACVPGNSDPKDMYVNIARMVNYICNTVVLTFWQYIDQKMTPRLARAICDMVNIWLNGLTNMGHLLGGRCELMDEENPITDLMAGIVRPHIFIGVPGPAQEIDFIVEYDVDYLTTIMSA